MVEPIRIGQRAVGPDQPCFIIAEAGVNHNGSVEMALKLIDIAVNAGADAVKFQTFQADGLVAAEAPKAAYQKETAQDRETQYEMLARLQLSCEAHRELLLHCQRKGILFMSAPFDEESADFLIELGVPALKIPSGEITNLPLINHVASKGSPLFVSTGMATLEEVREAVDTIWRAKNPSLVLLHCVSNYPADPADANLRAIQTMTNAFSVPVGYSDHTLGIEIALAAGALGACVIEKHFTLDRDLPGPDHGASVEPDELSALVCGIRKVEASLGHGRKEPVPSEAAIAAVSRKSLVAACKIPEGTMLSEDVIAIRRPGTGLPPSFRSRVVGRKTKQDIAAGTLLELEMLH